jgi:CheY-like chemotaxis protein
MDFLVANSPLAPKEKAWYLHRMLLSTIEELNPGPQAPIFSHEWRRYRLLVLHYVDGRDPQSVADELGVSRRHYYREHEPAMEAIASLLWQNYACQSTTLVEPTTITEAAPPFPLTRLELLRLEAVRLTQSERYARLTEVTHGVVDLVQDVARSRGICLQVSLEDNLPPVSMDRGILRQILLGLLSYLVEHLSQGDLRITASLQEGLTRLCLYGSSTGSGDEQTRTEDKRTQIATLNELAELQGARVQPITDQPGIMGFSLALPGPAQRTILVVDDNEDVLQLFQRYLAQEHYRVLMARTSAEAIRLAREIHPYAITLDLMMPDQDGWDILQTLTNQPETQQIPVIICTVLSARDLALSLGASAFLEKPVTQPTLLATLRALAEG